MCNICKEWKSGKLASEKAFKEIGKVLKNQQDKKIIRHLVELSDIILNSDLPVSEPDESKDKEWWDSTHKIEDDQ